VLLPGVATRYGTGAAPFGVIAFAAGLAAALGCIIGLLAERRLFFAAARHTVRLFHGDRRA